ncbi:MAG: polyamine ABC transporter ATP-binding protein [Lachnospiraceae bacterium]|nr:polyamine ABC transporter ATP-binding protein [Lachnospiraceae bacterium]MBO5146790.1 polyamine ABC transporter ATP-binding protein [Lachnospiraceae bacterium]
MSKDTIRDNIIELKHISRTFDDGFRVVEDFNLTIQRGEFVTFLGPSGCGKTTTLRMIAGFDKPTEGELLLNGEDIRDLPPNKRPINTVFQRYALFPHLNVFDNIAFGLKLKKLPKAEIIKKVKKALEMVDLEDFEERRIQTLSGGQQQRIAIARALVNEPEILLLDEPLGALDLKMRKEMQLELKSMHEKLGITFIYVTHDQEEALTMSDKIVVMSEGKIQQIGTPEDIYNEPKNAFVADFIGESNIFSGIMTGKCRVRFCGAEFECVDDVEHGTMIDAVVRPEDVTITAPDQGIIKGRVTSVIFKGVHYEIAVQSGKNEIVVQSTRKAEVNAVVGLYIEPEGIHIMIAEDTINRIESGVDKDYRLYFLNGELNCDMTALIPGTAYNTDGALVDAHGDVIEPDRIKVIVSVKPEDITMSDDKEAGMLRGHIINLIYKGDHYSYVVRTEEDEDFIVDDEYLWNMDDYVSLVIPKDKFNYTLKK